MPDSLRLVKAGLDHFEYLDHLECLVKLVLMIGRGLERAYSPTPFPSLLRLVSTPLSRFYLT